MKKESCICGGTFQVVESSAGDTPPTTTITMKVDDEDLYCDLPTFEIVDLEDAAAAKKIPTTTTISYEVEDVDPSTIDTPLCDQCGSKTVLETLGIADRPYRPGVISTILWKPHCTACDHWLVDWKEDHIYGCLCGRTAQRVVKS